jgi:hypothetical protein
MGHGVDVTGNVIASNKVQANNVNSIYLQGGATTIHPALIAFGTDNDVGIYFGIKGTGEYNFADGASASQFRVVPTANAVNYLYASGGATGGNPRLQSRGAGNDVGMDFTAKGSGEFYYRSNGGIQFCIGNTGTPINYLRIAGAAANAPELQAQGNDPNIGIVLRPKGSGSVLLAPGGVYSFVASHTTSGVNYIQCWPGVAGSGPTMRAQGTDNHIPFWIGGKGTGSVYLTNDGQASFEAVGGTANGNWLQAQGAAGNAAPILRAVGAGTNISMDFMPKGSGQVTIHGGVQATALTLAQGAPVVHFNETDQTNGAGRWRLVADGNTLRVDKNTATDNSFSTYTTCWTIDSSGYVGTTSVANPATTDISHKFATTDFVDRKALSKTGGIVAGNIEMNTTAAERRVQFNNTTVGSVNMAGFFHRPSDNVLGMYDWTNTRLVWDYNPTNNKFSVSRDANFYGTLAVTGLSYFTGRTEVGAVVNRVVNLGTTSGAIAFNLATTAEINLTLNGTTTFSLDNVPAANLSQVTYLRLTNGGAHSITWPTGTKLQFTGTLSNPGTDLLALKWDSLTSFLHVYLIKKGLTL